MGVGGVSAWGCVGSGDWERGEAWQMRSCRTGRGEAGPRVVMLVLMLRVLRLRVLMLVPPAGKKGGRRRSETALGAGEKRPL